MQKQNLRITPLASHNEQHNGSVQQALRMRMLNGHKDAAMIAHRQPILPVAHSAGGPALGQPVHAAQHLSCTCHRVLTYVWPQIAAERQPPPPWQR